MLATAFTIHTAIPVTADFDISGVLTSVGTGTSTIFGTDDRVSIPDTTSAPYNAVCRLVITYQNGAVAYGTGFIYGSNVLATAAHCLYDTSGGRGGQVSSITVYPAAGSSGFPFESRTVDVSNATFHYPQKWEKNRDWKYDFGVIEVDQPWDSRIQPLRLTRSGAADLEGKEVTILGYDYRSFDLYRSAGRINDVRDNDLLYRIDIMSGQSGGPIIDASGRVVGIANYGAEEGGLQYNSGARITTAVYRYLMSFVK